VITNGVRLSRTKIKSQRMSETIDHTDLMLTDEELNSFECVKNLSSDQKRELSLIVLELSFALYNLYSEEDE